MSLVIQGISKKWGEFSLETDELTIAPGARVVLMGPSGSGKSSLIRIITGLESLDGPGEKGKIFLDDQEITQTVPESRQIGVVFQDPALFPSLNVVENAAFGLRMRGVSAQERRSQVMPWLERLGMARMADSSVDRLSGGEAQRVALIRALVWKPKALLLDEPFSALDSELRDIARRELLELHALCPVPMLLVTHDEADAQVLATERWSFDTRFRPRFRIKMG